MLAMKRSTAAKPVVGAEAVFAPRCTRRLRIASMSGSDGGASGGSRTKKVCSASVNSPDCSDVLRARNVKPPPDVRGRVETFRASFAQAPIGGAGKMEETSTIRLPAASSASISSRSAAGNFAMRSAKRASIDTRSPLDLLMVVRGVDGALAPDPARIAEHPFRRRRDFAVQVPPLVGLAHPVDARLQRCDRFQQPLQVPDEVLATPADHFVVARHHDRLFGADLFAVAALD